MTRQLPTPPSAAMMRRAATQVRRSVQLAVAAGVIPVPAVDLVVIQRVQLRLIRRLSQIFQVPYSTREAKAILVQVPLVAGSNPSVAVQGAGSVSKWLPAYGLIVGTGSVASLAGFSTHQLGKVLSRHLANGGCLADFKWPLETESTEEKMAIVAEVVPPVVASEPEPEVTSKAPVLAETISEPVAVVTEEETSSASSETAENAEVVAEVTITTTPEPIVEEKTPIINETTEAELVTDITPSAPADIEPAPVAESEPSAVEIDLPVSMPLKMETISVETLTVELTENTKPETEAQAVISEPEPAIVPVSTQTEHSESEVLAVSSTEAPAQPTQLCQKCLFWWIVLLLVAVGIGSWVVLYESPPKQINEPALRMEEPAKTVSATDAESQ